MMDVHKINTISKIFNKKIREVSKYKNKMGKRSTYNDNQEKTRKAIQDITLNLIIKHRNLLTEDINGHRPVCNL